MKERKEKKNTLSIQSEIMQRRTGVGEIYKIKFLCLQMWRNTERKKNLLLSLFPSQINHAFLYNAKLSTANNYLQPTDCWSQCVSFCFTPLTLPPSSPRLLLVFVIIFCALSLYHCIILARRNMFCFHVHHFLPKVSLETNRS